MSAINHLHLTIFIITNNLKSGTALNLFLQELNMSPIFEIVVNIEGAELSHEAAVGKIADFEIEYLMTRGLSEDEATSAIIRGFMDTSILGLPQDLADEVNHIMYEMDFGA